MLGRCVHSGRPPMFAVVCGGSHFEWLGPRWGPTFASMLTPWAARSMASFRFERLSPSQRWLAVTGSGSD